MKSIGTIVLSLYLAAVASEFIYLFMQIPRLSDYSSHAPLYWWLLIFSPFGVACVIVGWFANGAGSILIYSLFASVTGTIGRLTLLRAIGNPPDQDISLSNLLTPDQLKSAVPVFLICWLILAAAMSSSHAFRINLQKKKLQAA